MTRETTRIQIYQLNHGEIIMTRLNEDRKSAAKYCDFRIIAEDHTFPVHKNIVGSVSDFFERMFFIEMKEQYQQQAIIEGVSKDIMEIILEFLYTSKIEISRDNVFDVIEAANYLNIPDVKKFCATFLVDEVEPENCFSLKKYSKMYELEKLSSKVDEVLMENLEDVLNSNQFKTLDFEEVKTLFHMERKNTSSEDCMYKAMIDWIKHDVASRAAHTAALFKMLKLNSVSWDLINEAVMKEPLIQESLESMNVLVQAMSVHPRTNVILQQPEDQRSRNECLREEEDDNDIEESIVNPFNVFLLRDSDEEDPCYEPLLPPRLEERCHRNEFRCHRRHRPPPHFRDDHPPRNFIFDHPPPLPHFRGVHCGQDRRLHRRRPPRTRGGYNRGFYNFPPRGRGLW